MYDGLSLLITKGHVPQCHIALHFLQQGRMLPVFRLLFLVHQVENPLRRCQGGIQFIGNIGNLIDGAGKLSGIQDKRRNLSQGNPAFHV